MKARCTKCSKLVEWHNTRGSKLADNPCPICGGKFERLSYRLIFELHPTSPDDTFDWNGRPYHYRWCNSKREYFITDGKGFAINIKDLPDGKQTD
jgi:hypothetical protein